MKSALAIIPATMLLASCTLFGHKRPATVAIEPITSAECEFVADFIDHEHAAGDPALHNKHRRQIVLTRVALGMGRYPPATWRGRGPPVADDMATKSADAHLDACPGLQERLRGYGWGFWDRHTRPGWYWTLSRVAFSEDHTQAIVFITEGWKERRGDTGLWAWYSRDAGTGRWTKRGNGGGWTS